MLKNVGWISVFMLAGVLFLAACGGSTTSTSTGVTGARVKEDSTLGSAPGLFEPDAAEGPAARGATTTTSDAAAACLTTEEGELARLVNEYRASLNLPPVQVSKSLNLVAQQHAWDSTTNGTAWPAPPAGQTCNMHSWTGNVNPALQQGTWTAVCYTSDHANAQGMWDKPGELAGYPGIGVENSFAASNGATPQGALTGWQNSPGHNAVITEQNGWTRPAAMGVGINGNFAHLWFGYVADPAGEALLCNGGSAMTPPTAVPPTTAPPTAEQPTVAAPTAVPPTAAAPTGTILNENGTIADGGTTEHTFNVAQGRTYTVLVTPSAEFDVAPSFNCTLAGGGGASGNFDWHWEGEPETFTYTPPAGTGSCQITVGGYLGSTGTYTIVVTAQ